MYTLVTVPYSLFQDSVSQTPPSTALLVNSSGVAIAKFSDTLVAQTVLNALNA